jgi:Zn finger protein HypA/HybF involved in hydrogenase expression
MHEVAAIRGAISAALEAMQKAGASRIAGVQMTLGVSGHFSEESVRQYFDLLTADTPASGAALTLSWLPATYQCFECQHCFESLQPVEAVACTLCGGAALGMNHQQICTLSALEVIFEEAADAKSTRPMATMLLIEEATP